MVRIGDAEVDLVERRLRTPRGEAALTELEVALLRFLLERRGSTTTRQQLLEEVWGYHPRTVTRAVDHTVSRLRKKLEVDPRRPRWLTATRGGGYRLEIPSDTSPPLPEEPSSFVGRKVELERLLGALEEHRVVALLGPTRSVNVESSPTRYELHLQERFSIVTLPLAGVLPAARP